MDRKQIDKMIAVALSPGAYEKEAIAALMKARAVVQKNPSLAHPEPLPKVPSAPKPDHSIQYTVSHVTHQRGRHSPMGSVAPSGDGDLGGKPRRWTPEPNCSK
jgi:hypothetical protein